MKAKGTLPERPPRSLIFTKAGHLKKLTKKANAFGLTFDVHPEVTHITVDAGGLVQAHYTEPKRYFSSWYAHTKGLCNQSDWLCRVDLEGANWQECFIEL